MNLTLMVNMDEWHKLAYLILRSHLDENSLAYINLKEKINESESRKSNLIIETGRSIENKILRGTFSLAFYLESIYVLNLPMSPKLQDNFCLPYTTWASKILRQMVKSTGLTYHQFAEFLTKNGVIETAISLRRKMQRGTFRFAYFLQVEELIKHTDDVSHVTKSRLKL